MRGTKEHTSSSGVARKIQNARGAITDGSEVIRINITSTCNEEKNNKAPSAWVGGCTVRQMPSSLSAANPLLMNSQSHFHDL
eukprot:scaffold6474_cov23-Cyclotella_meneghiniana.AAC.9